MHVLQVIFKQSNPIKETCCGRHLPNIIHDTAWPTIIALALSWKSRRVALEICNAYGKKEEGDVEHGTIQDPPLVRKYANVLAQRLSEGDGHLVCFPKLEKRHKERGAKDRKV